MMHQSTEPLLPPPRQRPGASHEGKCPVVVVIGCADAASPSLWKAPCHPDPHLAPFVKVAFVRFRYLRTGMGVKVSELFADRYGPASLIRRLLVEEGLRHWRSYALNFALMGIVAACTALSAYLIGHVVNETYLTHNFSAILLLAAVTIVIFSVKGFASYGQAIYLARIGTEITARNQQRLIGKLLTESMGYFADRPSALVMTQVNFAATSTSGTLDTLINAVGRDTLALIGLTAVMITQDPMLSIIGILLIPYTIIFLGRLTKRVRVGSTAHVDGTAKTTEAIQECLQGLRVVKAFGLEQEMMRRVERGAQATRKAANTMARLSSRSSPLMETLGGFVIAAVFVYGGYSVIVMGSPPGAIASFITAFVLAYEPAKRLARLHVDLTFRLAGVRILYEVLDSPPTEPNDPAKPDLHIPAGRIEFSNVGFSYRPDQPAIRGMSFLAQPGCMTALVGPSGGGKSTAFNLILRLYEPQKGAILIDGNDIGEVSLASVRRQIAYVGQDVFLFRGSIRDNILCGNPCAREDEIIKAAKAAEAHDFITAFPDGYDTPVGEHGLQLSSGQRQRISIARALMRDAPIILLDEPTSSLDSELEQLIQNALAQLCVGRTTLVIAHRLNTVKHADRIHVVEAGMVVESGSHQELLYQGGRYAALYRHMLRDTEAEGDNVVAFRAAG